MNHGLTTELYWLVLTIVMTAVFWMPIIGNRILETGVWATLKPPQLQPNAQWAERMRRAHANSVENLVLFAPLVLAIQMTGMNNANTAFACLVYFYARLVHVLAYLLAVPLIRTLAFTAGFFSQMYLALTLLGVF
jgi:uncharacterized MAPEG superfamily protein